MGCSVSGSLRQGNRIGGVTFVWYAVGMSHIPATSHNEHPVRLGDRGRLVLPAELRRALDLKPGDELVARLDGDGVRLVSRRSLARDVRGMLSRLAPERDLVAELLAERQVAAERE